MSSGCASAAARARAAVAARVAELSRVSSHGGVCRTTGEGGGCRESELYLVDLAGTERVEASPPRGPPRAHPEKCPRCRLGARQGVGRERRADGRGESDQQVALLARRRGETQPRSDPHPRCRRDVDEGWRGAGLGARGGLRALRGARCRSAPARCDHRCSHRCRAGGGARLWRQARAVPQLEAHAPDAERALGLAQDSAAPSLFAGGSAEGPPTSIGSSKTLMFVNISPLAKHYNESVSSLRFAQKVNGCLSSNKRGLPGK